ncbi:hypothetical protein KJZ61_00615 [Candidatus Dependentiae bacterium]|nr:hypothetical protein [Candidatus Dependentiae bacterium]
MKNSIVALMLYGIRVFLSTLILVPIVVRSDIFGDPLQFIKQKTQQIIDVKGDPLQFIKREIMSTSPVIADNPHKNDVARVRQGTMPAGPEELAWRAKRFPRVKAAQEKFLGMKLTDKEVLEVAISCSGGGFRAMLGSLGSLRIAQESGLLDCVMCISGLSGSTWLIGPWITSGVSLAEYKKILFPRLKNGPVPSQSFAANVINNLLVKFTYEQPLTPVDLYGGLLADVLLGPDDANYVYPASYFPPHPLSQAQRIADATYPLPVYTAVLGDMDYAQEWFECTPYEVGCRAFNAYVPTWAFGRKFKNGESTDNAPEQTLGYWMGICGSAFAANFEQAYDTVLNKFINDPFWREIVESFVYTDLGKIRIAYAQINNFMYEAPGFELRKRKTIKLVDAGLDFGNPVFATYRNSTNGGMPDVLLVFDYGGAIGNHEIAMISNYAQRKGLKFPPRPSGSAALRVLTTLKDAHDTAAPVVFYLPRFKDDALLAQYKQQYPYYAELLANLDWEASVEGGFAAMNNMQYTKEQAEQVCGLMEFNLLTQLETIREGMRQKVLEKRRLRKRA